MNLGSPSKRMFRFFSLPVLALFTFYVQLISGTKLKLDKEK